VFNDEFMLRSYPPYNTTIPKPSSPIQLLSIKKARGMLSSCEYKDSSDYRDRQVPPISSMAIHIKSLQD